MWGNDNGGTSPASPITKDFGSGASSISSVTPISQKWKIVIKDSVPTVKLSIPESMVSSTNTGGPIYVMVVSDDANFSTTITTLIGTKEPTITAGTTAQYWRGDKSWQTLPVYTLSGLGGVPATRKLTINGTPVDEPYIFKGNNPSEMTFDITVDPGKIWVMGDHRGASADSRYHQDDINKGQVPLSRVTGRVFGVIWPFANAKIVPSVPVLK